MLNHRFGDHYGRYIIRYVFLELCSPEYNARKTEGELDSLELAKISRSTGSLRVILEPWMLATYLRSRPCPLPKPASLAFLDAPAVLVRYIRNAGE